MMLDISAKYLEDVLRKIPKSKNMPRNIKMSKNGSITYSIKRFAFPGKIENKQSHNALKTEKLKSFSNKKSVDENHSRMKRLQLKTYSHFRVNTDNTPNQFAFQNNALFRITSDTKRPLIDINNLNNKFINNQELSLICNRDDKHQILSVATERQ